MAERRPESGSVCRSRALGLRLFDGVFGPDAITHESPTRIRPLVPEDQPMVTAVNWDQGHYSAGRLYYRPWNVNVAGITRRSDSRNPNVRQRPVPRTLDADA